MGSASTSNGIVASVTAINASSRNDKSSSDHPNIRFGGHREDKENQGPSRDRGGHTTIGVPGHSGMILIHEDDDEDGPILYRDDDDDDDELEDEDRLAAKLARKDSLTLKLSQRPGRQELIDRNILPSSTEEERRIDRTAIGAKLIRRLSLRPTPEELEDRNI